MRAIALLRGVNVGGHNPIPMRELCRACEELGWCGVRAYIQSGNVLFSAPGAAGGHERALERVIESHFGLRIPVIARSSAQWHRYLECNPFREQAASTPSLVALGLSKARPQKNAVAELQERATNGERVACAADALFVHFPAGFGRTKLSPGLIDRLVGSPVTMRNWRTVMTIAEMLRQPAR